MSTTPTVDPGTNVCLATRDSWRMRVLPGEPWHPRRPVSPACAQTQLVVPNLDGRATWRSILSTIHLHMGATRAHGASLAHAPARPSSLSCAWEPRVE